MTVPIIAFFNNKGGVGKTTLVYHLAWMFSDLGKCVLAADLDPQANLTAACLNEDQLELLWPDGKHPSTIYGAIEPLLRGIGDILQNPHCEKVSTNLYLLPGDLALSKFEDELSQQWPQCNDGKERAFRVISAFWRILQSTGKNVDASVILIDLGPNLGAINRAALIAADYLVIPLTLDLFSLQGLKNLGPTVRNWREEWQERAKKNPDSSLMIPSGKMKPVGYIVSQHAVRLDRPVKAYERWLRKIPEVYMNDVLGKSEKNETGDSNQIGLVKHYRSLIPLGQEAGKPVFHLTPADGALGAHASAARDAFGNFKDLAIKISKRCGLQN